MDIAKYSAVLWDIPQDATEVDERLIIKRTLSFGGFFLLKDLIKSVGIDPVKVVFKNMKATEMPSRRYHFLKDFFFA
jgi:hypothetical protein